MKYLLGFSAGMNFGLLLGMLKFGLYVGADHGIVGVLYGVLLSLSFCGFPPITSQVLLNRSKSPAAQAILCAVSHLYGVWFLCCMCYSYSVLWDMQSERIVLFAGFYALPVLLPLWITAHIFETRHRKKPAEP